MNPKEIKNMIDFIAKSGLAEVNIETEEFKIKVKRDTEAQVIASAPATAPAPVAAPAPTAPASAATEAAPAPEKAAAKDDSSKYVEIKSPMIGTFYRSPKPEDPAFVNVGDTISAGDKVCIVEAMKLFNEIESEVSGTIVKVLVDNSSPVEYDQPLFLVDPA